MDIDIDAWESLSARGVVALLEPEVAVALGPGKLLVADSAAAPTLPF